MKSHCFAATVDGLEDEGNDVIGVANCLVAVLRSGTRLLEYQGRVDSGGSGGSADCLATPTCLGLDSEDGASQCSRQNLWASRHQEIQGEAHHLG